MAGVIEDCSKFEISAVVRLLQEEGVSQSECLRPEYFGPKGNVCAVQQI
jgi:hypothetical protein